MTTFKTVSALGLEVFYREAGEPGAPKLLLLGGFPSSSHQFRNLMPALADQFHLVAFDYPGFGNTEMPDPATWDYTFDHLAEVVDGGAAGDRVHRPDGHLHAGLRRPDRQPPDREAPRLAAWQVIQNANTYEEGFTAAWDGIRHVLWANRSPETEAPLEAFLEPDTVKAIYLTGHPDPAKISPDNWNMDLFFLARPQAHRVQLDLFYDYRTNAALYPAWQERLRTPSPRRSSSGGRATSSSPPKAARPTCATCRTPPSCASTPGTSPSRTASTRSSTASRPSTGNSPTDAPRPPVARRPTFFLGGHIMARTLPAGSGFHAGELDVQRRAGVRPGGPHRSRMLEPVELSAGIAGFLAERTFAALTARDQDGRLWITAVGGPRRVPRATSLSTLEIRTAPAEGDPLHGLPAAQSVGMVWWSSPPAAASGSTAPSPARTRTAGHRGRSGLRQLPPVHPAAGPRPAPQQHVESGACGTPRPSPADIELIRAADTFFLGTTHPERGSDASHRGGPPGFVRVEGDQLWWPDYPGNNMFNSFGNLAADPEAALLFLDFATGHALQLSGTAQIEWAEPGGPGDDGHTGRRARFTLQRLTAGSRLAAHQTVHRPYPGNPAITG
jgi:hypothetical protein